MTTAVPVISPDAITAQKTMFFMAGTPSLTPPHVKRRIAPKRWRSGLVPCTDKIGHRSDRRCRRWSGRCEPRNVDRTPGVEANAVANVLAELSSPGIRQLPTSGEAFWGRASLLSVATCGPRQHLPMQIWNGRILHRYLGSA